MRRRSNPPTRRQYRSVGVLIGIDVLLIGAAICQWATPVASLGAARKVLRGPATISVIGDSTGNDRTEWVSLWAADLGRNRRVRLHRWLDGRYRPDPLTFGSQGHPVTIWNASKPGATVSWASSQLDFIQPERPDLVIISFGHNNTANNIAPQLDDLVARLDENVPVVLILQNPGRGAHREPQAATLMSAQRWADAHEVPTVNVTVAFIDPDGQMLDDAHPNRAGSRVWATTVADALRTE